MRRRRRSVAAASARVARPSRRPPDADGRCQHRDRDHRPMRDPRRADHDQRQRDRDGERGEKHAEIDHRSREPSEQRYPSQRPDRVPHRRREQHHAEEHEQEPARADEPRPRRVRARRALDHLNVGRAPVSHQRDLFPRFRDEGHERAAFALLREHGDDLPAGERGIPDASVADFRVRRRRGARVREAVEDGVAGGRRRRDQSRLAERRDGA
eukprot:31417-Pelagococcus_subviridis.AAC.7